jgi:hypothetical protein
MTSKSPLEKILQGILHTENESKQNQERTGSTKNHKRRKDRKDKEAESNIDSAAHNQTFKQQKQLNGRNHHTHMNIKTECHWT